MAKTLYLIAAEADQIGMEAQGVIDEMAAKAKAEIQQLMDRVQRHVAEAARETKRVA